MNPAVLSRIRSALLRAAVAAVWIAAPARAVRLALRKRAPPDVLWWAFDPQRRRFYDPPLPVRLIFLLASLRWTPVRFRRWAEQAFAPGEAQGSAPGVVIGGRIVRGIRDATGRVWGLGRRRAEPPPRVAAVRLARRGPARRAARSRSPRRTRRGGAVRGSRPAPEPEPDPPARSPPQQSSASSIPSADEGATDPVVLTVIHNGGGADARDRFRRAAAAVARALVRDFQQHPPREGGDG